jgi:dolichol-phosphate mannosyltransferase
MVRAWQNGADVVFGVRRVRTGETMFKRSTAWAFYWLLHRLGAVHIRRNVGDFRLLSRRALEAVSAISGPRPFFRDATAWIGFATADVGYERPPRRTGWTKFSLGRMCALAIDGVVSSSIRPLYFSWAAAALVSILAVVLALGNSAAVVAVMLLSAVLLLIGQGIQGLYLARILEESRGRPPFLVAEQTQSMPDGVTHLRGSAIVNGPSCRDRSNVNQFLEAGRTGV